MLRGQKVPSSAGDKPGEEIVRKRFFDHVYRNREATPSRAGVVFGIVACSGS